MSQARRATKAQQQQQHASSYPAPAPHQSGYAAAYPQQGYPQHTHAYAQQPLQHAYPQPQSYAPQPQQYSQHAQAQQQYAEQQYAQQQYAQQQAAYAQQQYAQQQYAQQQAAYAQQQAAYAQQQQYSQYPQYPQQQPHAQSDPTILESGIHPADLEGRTIVRPSFGAPPSPAPTPEPAVNALHNDTVIAISPFADPFAMARLQQKSDPPAHPAAHGSAALAETKIAAAPSPTPAVVGHVGPTAFAQTALQPQYSQHQPQHVYAQPQPQAQAQAPMLQVAPAVTRHPSPGATPARKPVVASPKPRVSASIAAAGPSLHVGVRGLGSVDVSKLDKFSGRFGRGMVPVLGLAAVVVALGFDVLFMQLPIHGGFLAKLWYFTTALSFAAAGYGAALTTRASKGFILTSAVVVGLIYGAGDLGLESFVGVPFSTALIIAIQGVVIALVCGIGAAITGLKHRA